MGERFKELTQNPVSVTFEACLSILGTVLVVDVSTREGLHVADEARVLQHSLAADPAHVLGLVNLSL